MANDDIQVTQYGGSVPGDQPGGETYDPNSYHGIGDRSNQLTPGVSVALTPEERLARFGVAGKSTGLEFQFEGHTYRDDDTAAQFFEGRDEGKRIDVYQGGGAETLGRVRREGTLGPTNLLGPASTALEPEPDIQASSPLDLHFDTTEEQADRVNNESPYEAWKRNNPLLAEVTPKTQVLEDMHKSIAPEMDPEKFNTLAQSPAGYQAIKNIQANVSPLQQWRKDHPEFAFYDDEQVTRDTYNKMVGKGRIDPEKYDYDAFKMVFNPPNPILSAWYNMVRGQDSETLAHIHNFNRQAFSTLDSATGMLRDSLNAAFPSVAFSNDPNAPAGGAKAESLMSKADQWTIEALTGQKGAGKAFTDFWNAMDGWLRNQANWQAKQVQANEERASTAQGPAGSFGRFLGGTTTDFGMYAPLYAMVGGESVGAAVAATAYLGISRYGDAIQAGEDNALLKGVEGAFTAVGFRYMTNSPIGRLKTGFLNFALNSGKDQYDKMIKGEPSNWSEFSEHAFVDIGLGVLMGKSADRGPYTRYQQPSLNDLYYEPKTRPASDVWQIHVPHNGGIPPAAHDAMLDALDARARGDYKGAAELLDKAMAILSPKERQDVAARVIASVKGESQPGEAGDKHDDHYFGVSDIRQRTPNVPHRTIEGFENEDFGNQIREAYDNLVGEQGGLHAVYIGDLAQRSGVPIDELQSWLKEQARMGNADLHPPTLLHHATHRREAAFFVEGQDEPIYLATLRFPDETSGRTPEPTSPREDQAVSAEPIGISEEPQQSALTSAIDHLGGAEGAVQGALPAGQGETPDLLKWAERNGKVVNLTDLQARIRNGYIGRGAFHRVYRHPDDPSRVIKIRAFDPTNLRDQQDQLRDYHYMNEVFGSDIKLESIGSDESGQAIVTSMPFIEQIKPKPDFEEMEQAIAKFMKEHGFTYEGDGRWENQKLGVYADDAHTGNLIWTPDGRIVPIDLIMGDLAPKVDYIGPITAGRKLGVPTDAMLHAMTDSQLAAQADKYRADPAKREKWQAVVKEQMRRQREGGGPQRTIQGAEEGPVSLARRQRIDPEVWLKTLTDSELAEARAAYEQDPKAALAAGRSKWNLVVKEQIRRQNQRGGQGGFIIIPGADRIKRWFEAGLEPIREFGDWWHMEFDPEKLGEGAARAANVVRRENVKAAGAEDLRNWLWLNKQVDEDLRGAQKIMRRRLEFDQFSNDQAKAQFIAFEEGKQIKVPRKKQQSRFDYLFNKFYRAAYEGMADIEKRIADFGYGLRENYMYHAIRDKDRERFQGWLHNWAKNKPGWNADPRFTKVRDLPTWREVFAAGFEPKSYNFEDIFQMRLNAHTEALKRIRELRQLKDIGLAFLKNPKEKDIQARMAETGMSYDQAKASFKLPDEILHGKEWSDDWRAPNGERYVVDRNAALLLRNAWDQTSFYTSTNVPLRWYFKGMSALKGIGANILTWSLFHPKHILFTSLTNYTWDWMKAAATGKPWNPTEAWENAVKAVGLGAQPELDYFQNRRPITSLSQDELHNVDAVRWMGLNFGINHERAMQWNFARSIAEELPRLRRTLNATNKLTGAGFKWLTLQPVQEWMFGRLIPSLKMADALRDHAQLLKDHPEYLNPEHAEEYHSQLGQIGKALEAKYGEMFLDNLFWKKTTKEIFTAHLLSLGWQLSAIRVYAGGAKDLLDNAAALAGLRKKANNPQIMGLISDRMGHLGTYLGMYMLTNAAISWVNGYSQGKSFESKDLWLPVIGKNPPGSRDPWIRSAPGEFNRELAVLFMHIQSQGGGALGAIYGTANYAMNKLQPVASSMKQAFIDQKNYFGADIGGEPVDDDISKIADKLEYVLANSTLPIPFKTQLQAKPGVSEGVSIGGFMQDPLGEAKKAAGDILQWPTLWSMMGYPEAGADVGRSDVQNLISTEYGRRFGGGTKIQDQIEKTQAYEQYRQALASGDRAAIDTAYDNILALGKKQGFNAPKAIESVRVNALKGITADQYMFSRFDRKTQDKILRRATQDERAQYEKFLKHE